MAEWHFDPESTLESLSEKESKVFSFFLWGKKEVWSLS